MARQTLHRGLELALEQRYDDGLVQQLVFAPREVSCCLIIQMVVLLFLVPLPVVRLTPETEKRHVGTHVTHKTFMIPLTLNGRTYLSEL